MSSATVQDTKDSLKRDPEFSTFSFINTRSYFFAPDTQESEQEESADARSAQKDALVAVETMSSTQRSGSTSSGGSAELELPRIYYRLYASDEGAIFAQNPLDVNDPSLSSIFADWAPPPHTVGNLKRYICNREQFHPSRASVYLSRRDRSPALDYTKVDLLSSTLRPGSTPEKAIAIVVQLDAEGLGTASDPLPIAYRCKKGMEEMAQAIRAVVDATAQKRAKLAMRIKKLKERRAEAGRERERTREEQTLERERTKRQKVLQRELIKVHEKERVREREATKERQKAQERETKKERELKERENDALANVDRGEAARQQSPSPKPSSISPPVPPKTYRPPLRPGTYASRSVVQRARASITTSNSGSVTSRSIQRRHTTANGRPQAIRGSMIMMMPYLIHSSRG
ncbi:uncharacterized protein EI90DRAFT_3127502 [Cantharellus anzutake]|uniref:uncharacterized protein n=1 Tax=Cantharellus anzutake TaxID=1750568 RepID=UPI00190736B5|nr:uncharacterized protein EI90DRAFT_3127502 [Cantharellus anzutake]KAF8327009.1 hypothetical protein EI90DRAFT_3127502 [Cantharellus anzutake]